MTESSLDPELILKTQETLGKFVKKPPLTEKLLRKPPFKFIHDVIKVVIRDTNFLDELYTDEELNADNIKDREGKMKFLQKLIDVVKIVTKKDLQVKSSKVVAGLEAERTNELFQAIAFALENKLDSKDAVNQVKHGLNGNEPKVKQKVNKVEKASIVKPQKSQAPSRDRTPAKPEPKKAVTTQRSIEKKATLKEKSVKDKERSTSKSRAPEKETKKLRKTPSKEKETSSKVNGEVVTNGSIESQNSIPSIPYQPATEKKDESKAEVEQLSAPKSPEAQEIKVNGDTHHESEPAKEVQQEPPAKPQDELAAIIDEEAEFRRKEKINKKLSAKHRQKSVEDTQAVEPPEINVKQNQSEKVERFQSSFKRESVERPRTSLRPPSARPASSRPAAPRRRDKNIEIVLLPDEVMTVGDINIKMEAVTKELEDDGENLVIIEDSEIVSDSFMNERLSVDKSEIIIDENEQGKLVQQILETEKNFEGALGMETKKTEIEFDETKSQSTVKQVEHLKDLIQKLVRSINPMGKLMDFVQEDIDSMQREFIKWSEIYKQASIELKKEQLETAGAIEPLKYQLTQLEKMINEHHQSIDQLRGNLVLDEQKIVKMFTDV